MSSNNKFGLCVLLMLAACAQPIRYERETSPPPLPKAGVAVTAPAALYRIQPEASLVLIAARRDGKMAHLGHDHAIVSKDLQGFVEIASDAAASRAEIAMPLMNLIVDELEYRQRLALDTQISDSDRAGTYSNMRKVLEAEQFPWLTVAARFASADATPPEISASITLHGVTLEFLVPVQLDVTAERLTVSGQLTIKQSDFGLTPFSAVGGLLRVADELQVDFTLVAVRNRVPEGRSLSESNLL